VTPEPFRPRLGIGMEHGCALENDGSVVCWGTPVAAQDYGQETPPPGAFTELSAGALGTCGLSAGKPICWGQYPSLAPFQKQYAHFVMGFGGDMCALDSCGRATCTLAISAPNTPFVQVAVGEAFACGLTAGGALQCWGIDKSGESSPPTGTFTFVAAGAEHACAIRSDQSIACWGIGKTTSDCSQLECGQAAPPPGKYKFISGGYAHTCAIRTDGSVACWGAGTVAGNCATTLDCGQSIPPAGTFTEVRAGFTNSCGIQQDGHLVCWGSNTDNRSTPPTNYP
jgi:alpha-tubulin suppressor-like RCC1 family protein